MTLIHHTFAPLADAAYCRQALALMLRPRRWLRGDAADALRSELRYRTGRDVYLFASGREALLAGLRAEGIGDGDEVIVQGYTCVVVPNAVEATGAKTVYADIDPDTLNLTPETVGAVLTPRTRAIVCQHTFGIPADLSALRELCDARRILLIEDCAHVMADDIGPRGLGSVGDMTLLSFGRDKAISGVAGGALFARGDARKGLRAMEAAAAQLPGHLVFRYLLWPLLYWMARPLYALGPGKALLAGAGKMGLLPPIVTPAEKRGRMSGKLHAMPDACAALALSQLKRLRDINDRRRSLVSYYLEEGAKRGLWRTEEGHDPVPAGVMDGLPLQKFPLFVRNADGVRRALKASHMHLDDGWTGCVVCPRSVDPDTVGYVAGSDPAAEEVARSILSLPTHPTMTKKQAGKLLDALAPLLAGAAKPRA